VVVFEVWYVCTRGQLLEDGTVTPAQTHIVDIVRRTFAYNFDWNQLVLAKWLESVDGYGRKAIKVQSKNGLAGPHTHSLTISVCSGVCSMHLSMRLLTIPVP
jgi:hypothetical protein